MKYSIFISKIFVTGLAVSLLLFSPVILDFSLLPRFLALGLTVAITLFFIARCNLRNVFKVDVVTAAYLLYVLVCTASVIWAINKQEAIFESCKAVLFLCVFLISYFLFTDRKESFFQGLQKLSVITCFILALVIAYQFLSLKKMDKESLYFVNALNGHKNLLSSFLFLNLFFLISGWSKFSGGWKVVFVVAAFVTVVILFFLKTKAVWLGSIAAIILFTTCFYFRFKTTQRTPYFLIKLSVWLVIANVFFLCVLLPVIQKGADQKDNQSISLDHERLVLWEKTYILFHKHPLVGVGAGNWQINFPDATLTGLWRGEDLNYTFQRPHNDFLWILSETGLVGLNLFFIFIFSILIYLASLLRLLAGNRKDKREISLLIAFITGYFIIAFFDFPKERIEHGILINVILALAYSIIKNNNLLARFGEMQARSIFLKLSLVVPVFIMIVGMLRYKGEYYTRKMYDAKNSGEFGRVIFTGDSAQSFVYSLDPTSVPISWYLGNASALVSQPGEQSHSYFLNAYKLAPYNRNVLNDLASSYAFKGDYEMAKKYYLEAVRISPRFDDPKLNLVSIYIGERNYKLASECIQTIFHDSERRTQFQKIINAFQ